MMCKLWFKKTDLDKVTDKQMEDFIYNLDKGKLLNQRKKVYTSETKANIKKFIRKFYKWLLGDNVRYPELVDWIDTSKQIADIEAVPGLDKGVWEIVEGIPDIKRKALIWVTFDSGFRSSEILNCSIEDAEKGKDGIYYLRCRQSKTNPRRVSLPLSSKLLDRWLTVHPNKKSIKSSLWLSSRSSFEKCVQRYGKKAHKIHIHPHMLRHSSATYYSTRLSRTSFCKRFGWSYNSASPDRYIDFSKIDEEKVVEAIKQDAIVDIQRQLTDEKIRNQELEDRVKAQEKATIELKNMFLKSVKTSIDSNSQ